MIPSRRLLIFCNKYCLGQFIGSKSCRWSPGKDRYFRGKFRWEETPRMMKFVNALIVVSIDTTFELDVFVYWQVERLEFRVNVLKYSDQWAFVNRCCLLSVGNQGFNVCASVWCDVFLAKNAPNWFGFLCCALYFNVLCLYIPCVMWYCVENERSMSDGVWVCKLKYWCFLL